MIGSPELLPDAAHPDWRHRIVSRYCRAPEHRGRLRLIGWLKRLLRVKRVRVEVIPGVIMDLDERDYVQREILFRGGYETATLARFDRLLASARGCTDFGSHMGLYTLRAARSLAPRGGRVFCVEPTPMHAHVMLHNAALSGLRNIELCTAAVSDRPAILRMIAPHERNTGGSRLANGIDHDLRAIPLHVPVRPAADLAAIIPEECLDLVKLDIEGHEFRALQSLFGATATRPRDILLELRPPSLRDAAFEQDIAWLAREGYELLNVTGGPFSSATPGPEDNLWARRRDGA